MKKWGRCGRGGGSLSKRACPMVPIDVDPSSQDCQKKDEDKVEEKVGMLEMVRVIGLELRWTSMDPGR